MRTSNPALNERNFKSYGAALTKPMTRQGSINKTFILLFICIAASALTWGNWQAVVPYLRICSIAAFIMALVLIFKPATSPFLAPVYAIMQGVVIGAISSIYNIKFPGIVFQAVGITMATLLVMLSLYTARIIKVTAMLRSVIISTTFGVAFFYIALLLLGLFGVRPSFVGAPTPLSIGISLVVCVIAAFNFLLDFDFIERATVYPSLPKYMEWYGAFGILLTVIWLYIEVLSLLAKLKGRD
ncbi:putative YccA/Bax inhibitor family protein [Elusimicrobium posterum]|uniref:Bax inhibitor-1/YccA family protein n=1 Tax=Elusimicrobium posterum TaxID=3116653 RepID=UPI003C714CCE